MTAFGWQGGTIHQLAKVTGLTTSQILEIDKHIPENKTDNSLGWFAYRTCSLEHRVNVCFPERLGNIDYWHGVWRAVKDSE